MNILGHFLHGNGLASTDSVLAYGQRGSPQRQLMFARDGGKLEQWDSTIGKVK